MKALNSRTYRDLQSSLRTIHSAEPEIIFSSPHPQIQQYDEVQVSLWHSDGTEYASVKLLMQ